MKISFIMLAVCIVGIGCNAGASGYVEYIPSPDDLVLIPEDASSDTAEVMFGAVEAETDAGTNKVK